MGSLRGLAAGILSVSVVDWGLEIPENFGCEFCVQGDVVGMSLGFLVRFFVCKEGKDRTRPTEIVVVSEIAAKVKCVWVKRAGVKCVCHSCPRYVLCPNQGRLVGVYPLIPRARK